MSSLKGSHILVNIAAPGMSDLEQIAAGPNGVCALNGGVAADLPQVLPQ